MEMKHAGSLGQNVVVEWVCQMSLQVGPGALVGDHSLCTVTKDRYHGLQVDMTKSGRVWPAVGPAFALALGGPCPSCRSQGPDGQTQPVSHGLKPLL